MNDKHSSFCDGFCSRSTDYKKYCLTCVMTSDYLLIRLRGWIIFLAIIISLALCFIVCRYPIKTNIIEIQHVLIIALFTSRKKAGGFIHPVNIFQPLQFLEQTINKIWKGYIMEIKDPSKKYKTNTHLVYSCYYHVIFCPKYRRKCLIGNVENRIKELFLEISNKYNFEITDLEVMTDHVHMIISCDPSFGIMTVIHKLKGITSNILRKEFFYLKKMPSLWTRSCFISSVGSVSLEVVKKYIENQKGK